LRKQGIYADKTGAPVEEEAKKPRAGKANCMVHFGPSGGKKHHQENETSGYIEKIYGGHLKDGDPKANS